MLVGEEPRYSSLEEARSVMESLMIIYNQVNDQVFRRQPRLPKDCRLLARTMANFKPGAALHRWSRGFAKASAWLQDVWQEALAESDWEEYLTIHAILSAPGNDEYLQVFESEEGASPEEEHAELCLRMIPKAMMSLAELGRSTHESSVDQAYDPGISRH